MTEDQQKNAETAQAEAAEAAKAQAAAEETAEKAQAAEADQAEAKDEKAAAPDPKDEKIAQQEQQIADLQNRLLRLQADFDNFRKRNNEERERLGRSGGPGIFEGAGQFRTGGSQYGIQQRRSGHPKRHGNDPQAV